MEVLEPSLSSRIGGFLLPPEEDIGILVPLCLFDRRQGILALSSVIKKFVLTFIVIIEFSMICQDFRLYLNTQMSSSKISHTKHIEIRIDGVLLHVMYLVKYDHIKHQILSNSKI